MTREAKIGLLVALAFLLVIGILLSDHVTTATREPGAPLTSVEGSIRGSIGAPGAPGAASDDAGPPPVLPRVDVAAVEPSQPYTYPPAVTVTPAPVVAAADPWGNSDVPARTGAPLPNDALALAASTGGEPLVPATAATAATAVAPAPVLPPVAPAEAQKLAGLVEYKAQSGDVLSKIVARHLGRWTPENKEIFLRLNPKLRADPDHIVVGETYLLPKDAAAAAAVAGAKSSPAAGGTRAESPAKIRSYTVKSGDTLWRIAANVCGDPGKQRDILKLNADQIDDPREIGVGTVLKLPA